jgi:hypothetical protein
MLNELLKKATKISISIVLPVFFTIFERLENEFSKFLSNIII